jgi:hypothetical protein
MVLSRMRTVRALSGPAGRKVDVESEQSDDGDDRGRR